MTDERKEAFLKVWFDAPENIHWAHGMSNGVEKDISDTFDRAIAAWNTRPALAATDTGLVTVEPIDGRKSFISNLRGERTYLIQLPEGEYVTRSQAEELLAAKDAEIAKLSDLVESWSDMAINMEKHIDKLKADNAAKDARVEKLQALGKIRKTSNRALLGAALENGKRADALEAKLAAAEKERDHWKEYSSGQGKLIESGVFVTNDEYVRLIALEAKLAAAEKALESKS